MDAGMSSTSDSDQKTPSPFKLRFFNPILAGATLRERLLGCLGACIGICVTGLISAAIMGHADLPLIVAPIGASAVLLFAVPASPLAQPWSIVGGNTISALVGVVVAYFVRDTMLAVGLAVSLAILAMSLTRSLHPPGGAAALTAVIGGAAVAKAGFWFPFIPVALNSVILVGLGLVFHKLARRQYPHRPPVAVANPHKTSDATPSLRVGFRKDDIDAALGDLNETLDISRGDIDTLLRQVELRALLRTRGDTSCGDIMSRDVISVAADATLGEARSLLLAHDIRTLPVVGGDGTLVGTVGLRELATVREGDALPVSPAVVAGAEDPAIGLLPRLTDGLTHAVVIVDARGVAEGIVSQTDLLVTMSRSLLANSLDQDRVAGGQGI
jgi:CBS domain-containing membrane protein